MALFYHYKTEYFLGTYHHTERKNRLLVGACVLSHSAYMNL
jgi:hypothetical protein